MDEHDAHRFALLVVGRCRDERHIEPGRESDGRRTPNRGEDHLGELEEPGRIGEFCMALI